ncbi:hypothetical protein PG994_007623 [Apiospora phragmitis]|uniref:Uncharacterized protein n=1 Tax=Apiospora phragmitis TaxID=2905665 RepID=A0ABR1UQS2_9PEZI
MPYTSPTTEPFPQYDEYDYQSLRPQMLSYSPRAYEEATAAPDSDIKKSRVLNPAAVEFVSPSRTAETLTEGNTLMNNGKSIATPLKFTPVVHMPMLPTQSPEPSPTTVTPALPAYPVAAQAKQHDDINKPSSPATVMNDHKGNDKESKGGDKREGQSEIKDFASLHESHKSTADSVIPADKTGHAEERKSPVKKRQEAWNKHKQNKKSKSQTSQGTQPTGNGNGEQGLKESGNKAQSSDAKTASHSNDETDKQQRDNSQTRKQDQSGQKDVVSRGANAKGKSATKEVPANQPVVPGATWVDTEPTKATKKKNTKRHAVKGKASAKPASSSVTAAPTMSQEPDVKGEQGSGSQATSRGGGFENKAKGSQKTGDKSQDDLEKAVAPAPKVISDAAGKAPTGTTDEAKQRENLATQPNEAEQSISKESGTKLQKEVEASSSNQAKKWKGKKQKGLAASQSVTSQDKDQTASSAVTPATTDAKVEVERRDTMVSLSKADLPLILDDIEKVVSPSPGSKTPSLRDAPAPSSSPWRKDSKAKASDKRNEEDTSVLSETLREGDERKGG